MTNLDDTIGAATVATIFGVSKRTILRWVIEGELPTVGTAAGAYLFDRDAIIAIRDARIDALRQSLDELERKVAP